MRTRGDARTRSIVAAACAAVLGFTAVGLAPTSSASSVTTRGAVTISASTPTRDAAAAPSFDTQLLALINRFRISYGRQPLTMLADLSERSVNWSAHLRQVGALSHDRNLGAQAAAVCSVRSVRENVAFADAVTPSALLTDYINSAPHRANLLATDVRYIGLGTVTGASPQSPAVTRSWNTMKFVGGRCPAPVAKTRYQVSTLSIAAASSSMPARLIAMRVDVRTATSHPSWVAVYFTSASTHQTRLITVVQARTTSILGHAVAQFATRATTSGTYTAVYGGSRVTASAADLGSVARHSVTVTG